MPGKSFKKPVGWRKKLKNDPVNQINGLNSLVNASISLMKASNFQMKAYFFAIIPIVVLNEWFDEPFISFKMLFE